MFHSSSASLISPMDEQYQVSTQYNIYNLRANSSVLVSSDETFSSSQSESFLTAFFQASNSYSMYVPINSWTLQESTPFMRPHLTVKYMKISNKVFLKSQLQLPNDKRGCQVSYQTLTFLLIWLKRFKIQTHHVVALHFFKDMIV